MFFYLGQPKKLFSKGLWASVAAILLGGVLLHNTFISSRIQKEADKDLTTQFDKIHAKYLPPIPASPEKTYYIKHDPNRDKIVNIRQFDDASYWGIFGSNVKNIPSLAKDTLQAFAFTANADSARPAALPMTHQQAQSFSDSVWNAFTHKEAIHKLLNKNPDKVVAFVSDAKTENLELDY
jgi:hypothetical protein